jgi:hypothetical protein
VRLQFSNAGQAKAYYRICRKVLNECSSGPAESRTGTQRIRNAIFKGFGFAHFPDFGRNFARNEQVKAWLHSEEQLRETFSLSFGYASDLAQQYGFQLTQPIEHLAAVATDCALKVNEGALTRLLAAKV